MLEYRRVPISKYSIGDICPNLRNKNPISPSTNTATTNRALLIIRDHILVILQVNNQNQNCIIHLNYTNKKSLLLLHYVIIVWNNYYLLFLRRQENP